MGVITGKNLIKDEQKPNQLYIFKRTMLEGSDGDGVADEFNINMKKYPIKLHENKLLELTKMLALVFLAITLAAWGSGLAATPGPTVAALVTLSGGAIVYAAGRARGWFEPVSGREEG